MERSTQREHCLFSASQKPDRYLYADFTFRQGLEKMRNRGYTAIPVITRDGRYVGTVSEGDFLWRLLDTDDPSMKKAEELRVRDIIGSKYPAVRITVTMDALLESAMNQNFIPVIDDLDNFIGIVTRRDIISYLAKENENRLCAPCLPKLDKQTPDPKRWAGFRS